MNISEFNSENFILNRSISLLTITVGILIFIISFFISSIYVEGDQKAYHLVYESMAGLGFDNNLKEIYNIYNTRVTGNEYTHIFITIIGGLFAIDKNIYMSFFNGILAIYSIRLFLSLGANFWIAAGLVLTNYYFYVLYFAAERLKFAVLFLVLSLYFNKKIRLSIINLVISIFSHFSIVFIYIGIFLSKLLDDFNFKNIKNIKMFLMFLIFLTFLIYFNLDYFFSKINYYIGTDRSGSFGKLIPILLILIACTIYSENKFQPIILLSPIFIGIIIIGGSRLNMFGFFVFLYYGLKVKGGVNFGIIATGLYFLLKNIIFIQSVMKYGHGFH